MAGFSSGTGVGTRGGGAAGYSSVAASGVRFAPALRFCWNVWRSVHACLAVLLRRFAFGSRQSCNFYCRALCLVHACCLPHSAKQDGLREVPFLFRAGRDRHSAFSNAVRLSDFAGSLWVYAFLCGDPDGVRGTKSAARQSTLLRKPLDLAMFSAGNTLGAARPQTCAKESNVEAALRPLWTLFF